MTRHIVSVVQKQQEKRESQLAFSGSHFTEPRPHPTAWCHPHSERAFSLQLTLSGNNLIGDMPSVLGDSECSQVNREG